MWYNNANCDLYIGKGAGKKLIKDMHDAESEVKIVSPYLSPSLVKELIGLHKRNISIELITSDDIEDYYGQYEKNIKQLITQKRQTDEDAKNLRERWIKMANWLMYIMGGLITLFIGLFYFIQDTRVYLLLLPVLLLILVQSVFRSRIKRKKVFHYSYDQLFPFKVYLSSNRTNYSDTFIHSKIYLFDNKIAYLGSLNFTKSGTEYNHETRVRTTNLEAIKAINDEVNELFNNDELPERDIQKWGKSLYVEPIN